MEEIAGSKIWGGNSGEKCGGEITAVKLTGRNAWEVK